jgi:probable rRNA maturation factor
VLALPARTRADVLTERNLSQKGAPPAVKTSSVIERRSAGASRAGRLRVDVVATSVPPGLSRRSRDAATAGLGQWLADVAPARARGHVTVAVVSDAHVRALNLRYRGKNSTTDVLSFPAEPWGQTRHREKFTMQGPTPPLGDVVIAAGVARRQAKAAGHALRTELRVLALHGLLHLLGYDHETDNGRMARLEARLRLRGGLREGLIERGRRQ